MATQPRRYAGSIPEIAQAYQNDPRTQLSRSMLASGTSNAPVAQGGWAATDGLARAAQAMVGAFMNKRNEKKYSAREDEYTRALAEAAMMAGTPQAQPAAVNPATLNPATQQAAAALAPAPQMQGLAGQGVPSPVQSFDPGTSSVQQAPPMASLVPPQQQPPPQMEYSQARAPMSAQTDPMAGGTGPNRGAPASNQLSARDLYMRGIVAIEGGTDQSGNFRTSPKGAVGPGQIMPGTAPEAARLAGLPYDERRYRTDPEYNNALGAAYYEAQLNKFGDPLKAAAAYNAGPGAVSRAIRRANKDSGDWMDYLPVTRVAGKVVDTTKAYVERFAEHVGEGGTGIESVGRVAPPDPTMEALPEVPQAPTEAERPQPFELPDEVQSNRIAMAQRMLQSGNPDMVVIAQKYLDQGLSEQNAARMKRSDQQFDRDATDQRYGLQDYNDARGTAREFGYNNYRDTQQRNFGREQTYSDQSFRAGESAAERDQRTREINQSQWWQSQEAELDRAWKGEENEADRASGKGSYRNPLIETPTGLRIMKDLDQERDTNATNISNVRRFLDLNERQQTGGWVLGTNAGRSFAGMTDAQVKEMTGLANQITIGTLGGLGVAISDGDREFVSNAMVSAGSPKEANHNRGHIIIGVMERRNDYMYNWQLAQAEGRATDFMRSWEAYKNSVPVVNKDNKGNINANSMTYEKWLESRPRYDKDGRRVN